MLSILHKSRISAVAMSSLLIAAAFAVGGCGASQINQIRDPEYTDNSVRSLVIAPSEEDLFANDRSTTLTDAIGTDLAKYGYSVVDAREASALLAKHNVTPADMLAAQGLAALAQENVDAVLSVNSAGYKLPVMRHVKVTVTSTRTSRMIGEIDFKNSWGGLPGSPADAMMRKSPTEAAQAMAEALAKLLGPPGNVSGPVRSTGT